MLDYKYEIGKRMGLDRTDRTSRLAGVICEIRAIRGPHLELDHGWRGFQAAQPWLHWRPSRTWSKPSQASRTRSQSVKPVAPGRSQSNQSHSGAPGQTRRTGSNPVKPPANTAMGQILPIRFALRRTSAWLIKDGGDSLEEQNHDAPGGPHPPCNRKQHNVKNL
jgi:hypothetical protein